MSGASPRAVFWGAGASTIPRSHAVVPPPRFALARATRGRSDELTTSDPDEGDDDDGADDDDQSVAPGVAAAGRDADGRGFAIGLQLRDDDEQPTSRVASPASPRTRAAAQQRAPLSAGLSTKRA